MMVGALVLAMAITVFYGVMKLRSMQADFDARAPLKEPEREGTEGSESLTIRRRVLGRAMRPATDWSTV